MKFLNVNSNNIFNIRKRSDSEDRKGKAWTNSLSSLRDSEVKTDLSDSVDMKNSNISIKIDFYDRLIENLFSWLLFLLPFLFLPITVDILSINKFLLVLLVSCVGLCLFFVRAYFANEIALLKPRYYWGVLGLLGAVFLSFFYSYFPKNSLIGYYGNYTHSVSFILLAASLFFVSANLSFKVEKLFKFFVLGTTISTLFSIMFFYSIPIPFVGEFPRISSLVGSVYLLYSLQLVAVFISINRILDAIKNNNGFEKFLYSATFLINSFYLFLGLDSYVILIFATLTVYTFFKNQVYVIHHFKYILTLFVILVTILAVHILPFFKNLLKIPAFELPVRLPLAESWLISAEVIRDNPFTGYGLGTFVNSFSLYKPSILNLGPYWNIVFDIPFSDVFLWLATAGLVGLTAYVLFWVYAFKLLKVKTRIPENSADRLYEVVIFASFLSLSLLGFNYILYILVFMTLGLVLNSAYKNEIQKFAVGNTKFIAGIGIAIVGIILYTLSIYLNIYQGEIYFRRAAQAQDYSEVLTNLAQAVNSNPNESLYVRTYISSILIYVTEASASDELDEESQALIIELLQEAINNSNYLIQIEPRNVQNWILRGDLYSLIIDISEEAVDIALASYNQALLLDRSNPNILLSIGGIYFRFENFEAAAEVYLRAVQEKRDYANAYYNLAHALKGGGYLPEAIVQMEIVTRLLSEDNPDYNRAVEDLAEFRSLYEAAQANAQNSESLLVPDQEFSTDLPLPTDVAENSARNVDEPLVLPTDTNLSAEDFSGFEIADSDENSDGEGSDDNGASDDTSNGPIPSDGSEFDSEMGEREAPLANPVE